MWYKKKVSRQDRCDARRCELAVLFVTDDARPKNINGLLSALAVFLLY
jgi:hypothetical protein